MANDEIRMKSSSGGMFTLLAEYVLDKGGYVCGAAYDKDWSVHHIIINKKEDLDKIRGSKYLQSSMDTCYREIKELLKKADYCCCCGFCGLWLYRDRLGINYPRLPVSVSPTPLS